MTDQRSPLLDRYRQSMMLSSRLTLFKMLLSIVVLIAWEGSRCAAQYSGYPQSYPVTSPHPAATSPTYSYPAQQNVELRTPQFVDSTPVAGSITTRPSTVTLAPPTELLRSEQRAPAAGTAAFTFQNVRPESSRSGSPNKTAERRDTPARLASTSTHRLRTQFPIGSSFDSRQSLYENVSPYRPTMIESARQRAAQFRRIAQTASPIAAKIAEENAKFAEQWAALAKTYSALSERVADTKTKLNATSRDFEDVNSKLNKYGLTTTIGLLLRNKKEQLDDWQVQDSQTLLTSQALQDSRQNQLDLEMIRYDGSDAVAQSAAILAAEGHDSTSAQHAYLASQVEGLLRERHQWITALGQGYQDYQQKLGELDSATTASANLASDYRKLIDRQIIWIRSGEPLSLRDAGDFSGGVAALFDSRGSDRIGPTLDRKIVLDSGSGIGLLAFIVLVLVARWRAKSWLVGIGNRKRMGDETASSRKLAASVLTPVVALALPCILYAIGCWLGNGVVSETTLHASSAFYAASLVALAVEVPRQLLRNHGYVDKHVAVDLPGRQRATKYLTFVGFLLVAAAYTITWTGLIDHGVWNGSVARFAFIATMLLVACTAHLALRPTGGFLEPLIAKFGGNVIHRIRLVIYLAGIGFPMAMAALSVFGYGFTANEVIKRAIVTLVCAMIAWTLWAGVKIMSRRAWQILTGVTPPKRDFDEYGEIEPAKDTGETVTGTLAEHSLELKHQLAFLGQCSLVVGAIACLGWLWIDVFPNVRMGNPVVWTIQDTVTQSSIDATGQTIASTVMESKPITALHLLLAAATLFVAFQLAKLLPALWDALVLQRVSFDEGMEHFSLVLGRCLLFGVGCFIACKWVGIRWQAIQWLAVGLSIGLGFGLQDMVRNLFGGFIVLFEKPARLGDLITVGKLTGRVAAQKFRTTVLSDDDGRELIIPNKKFVSEDVVNWMGAGRLSVIPIEVAVTRDQRPADICRTLQELVIEQPDVLITPAPQATLVCVAKSSQRIELRAWIEEGQNARRYRDKLLTVVRNFLSEQKMLAATQPSQPAMHDDGETALGTTRIRTKRKRSA